MSLKQILSSIRKADFEFNLIEEGDRIAVGVSGGKDSMLLLLALKQYQRFPNKNFDFYAVCLDLGFGNVDTKTLQNYCDDLNIKLHIEDCKDVSYILSHHKNQSGNLPCSICSRMKKAAINKVAHQLNCNKVAFAHHYDDALETLLMNTIYGGRLATFAPKMHLTDTDLIFIRPFILVREREIIATCYNENVPIIKSSCPNDHVTMREEAKEMLKYIYNKYPMSYHNYKNMLLDLDHFDLWFDKKEFPIAKDYTIKKCVTQKDFFESMMIRKEVFIKEFNIPVEDEFDPLDSEENVYFYLLCYKGKGVGTLSYVNEGNKVFRLRRFALLKDHRNKGVGKELLKFVECEISLRTNPCKIYFNAMKYLQGFYEKMGYKACSEEFNECNIPHIKMEKTISNVTKYKVRFEKKS